VAIARAASAGERAPQPQAECGSQVRRRHCQSGGTSSSVPFDLTGTATGGGTGPVSRGYIQAAVRQPGIAGQGLRADRLLEQAQANGGDLLQLTHTFGISATIAIRYCAEIGAPPGQAMRH